MTEIVDFTYTHERKEHDMGRGSCLTLKFFSAPPAPSPPCSSRGRWPIVFGTRLIFLFRPHNFTRVRRGRMGYESLQSGARLLEPAAAQASRRARKPTGSS